MKVIVVSRRTERRGVLLPLVTDALHPESVLAAIDLDACSGMASPADLLLVDLPESMDLDRRLAAAEGVPAAKRMLIVEDLDLALARAAYAHGFQGVLPAGTNPALAIAILKLVVAGGEYFPCFEEIAEAAPPLYSKLADRLTPRQYEVLVQMHGGRTNKEIAKSLGVSIATVKLHVQAILSAVGARNRTEAVSRFFNYRG